MANAWRDDTAYILLVRQLDERQRDGRPYLPVIKD
jgi:hypothetical protein